MFFSEKEKGLNNNYRSAGRGGGGDFNEEYTVHEKKNLFPHINAFKSNNFEFAGKTEAR